MKKFLCYAILVMISAQLFCHEARKQKEAVKAESLTQKWEECERFLKDTDENVDLEKYLEHLKNFYAEIEKSIPEDTVIYYFPESGGIYTNLYASAKELLALTEMFALQNEIYRRKSFLSANQQFLSLQNQICSGIRDWEILQKNISNFQMKQVYYSYRILIGVIIIMLFLTVLFVIMYALTSKSQQENKLFTRQMLQAQESERERISNELHDTVCQDLRVLQFQLENKESVELCKKIASDVRNTCYALTPSDLNEGILEAVISLCSICRKQSGVNVILSIQDEIRDNPAFKSFSREKNLNIYRIIQEILTNAVKHAGAENISVLIRTFDQTNFRIIISDDGNGFDMKTALKKKNHFGLKNIMTRTDTLQGQIVFNSEENEGTQIMVTVPL